MIGSIYAGWATATESAALGVIAAVGIAAWNRRLTLRTLLNAFEGTMRTTAMIMAILLAAYFLNFVITSIGLTGQVNSFITSLGLSQVAAPGRRGDLLLHSRHVHGDAVDDGGDGADHRADHVQGRLRPGVVRHHHHHPDGAGDDHPAGRHQPLRRAGPAQARPDRRRHHRRLAVRHHHAADAGDPGGLAADRAVAAADGGELVRCDWSATA